MRNTYKYTRLYSGAEPEFVEGDVFQTIIPLSEAATVKVGPTMNSYDSEEINGEINGEINEEINLSKNDKLVLEAMRKNKYVKRNDIISSLNISKSTLDRAIKDLKDLHLIERIGSNKTGYWEIK